ncbi:MAG: symmetrical bis(5'-nucleosyl)-tetraphosphatase [Gammaproteobacteria bacterium]|nr:symmetrical bis(5'-nucleosyl)-tetraphosphatase [Gammaproteobacteria bacterium]
MSTYAIGDVQGCYQPLQKLLEKINFNPDTDTLWFAGDLVNRGPESQAVLEFIYGLGKRHIVTLGNHDLYLMARGFARKEKQPFDTLDSLMQAKIFPDLLEWLRHLPLLHHDQHLGFIMTHAGVAPLWDLTQAKKLAHEVEENLQGSQFKTYLAQMYGDTPALWQDNLQGMARWRCIINYFTRMRYCYADGSLNFNFKGRPDQKPADLIPWFELPTRVPLAGQLIFGHWAALNGEVSIPHLFPLDTGCVWGKCLTALRLEDRQIFQVNCS